MANYYVRTSGGNNGNTGLSVAQGWDTITYAETQAVAGDIIYLCVMAGGEEFTPAATITFDVSGDDTSGAICWAGADSDGQLDGTVAVVDGSSVTGKVFQITGDRHFFRDIQLKDGGSGIEGWEISGTTGSTFLRCEAVNNNGSGFSLIGGCLECLFVNCLSDGNGSIGFYSSSASRITYYGCVANDNANLGLYDSSSGSSFINCLATNNLIGMGGYYFVNCTVYGSFAASGFQGSSGDTDSSLLFQNCLSTNNAGFGFNLVGDLPSLFLNCAHYNNTSGFRDTDGFVGEMEIGIVALNADPFRDAANDDFSLNNHPQGGRLCRGGGTPTGFTDTNTLHAIDIGCYYPAVGRTVAG